MNRVGKLPFNSSEWNKAVYVTTDVAKGYYNQISKDHFINLIPLSKKKLWTAYISFFMQKPSCLEGSFSAAITKFRIHGFIKKWIKDDTARNLKLIDKSPLILKLEHIIGIFYMCSGLYFVAFITLLIEILLAKWH